MGVARRIASGWLLSAVLLSGCSGSSGGGGPSPCQIPPGPEPAISLAYPAASAVVPSTTSELVFFVQPSGYVPQQSTVTLSSTSGTINGTALVTAPTPLPSPLAPPPQNGAPYSYLASTVQLAANTTYSIQVKVTDYTNLPEQCQKSAQYQLGSFSTGT